MFVKPLTGVKVVELSIFLGVPVCGRMLASLGADVIKIEAIEGEFFRREAPIFKVNIPCTDDENPLYLNANAGKRLIALDLKTPEGKKIFEDLIKSADVFITNIRRTALKRLGIDFERLHTINRALVYGTLDGYGEKGKDADKPGYDTQAYFARGGHLLDFGEPGSAPNKMVLGVGDLSSGTALLAGLMGALIGAKRSGEGCQISISLLNTAIWAASMNFIIAQHGVEFPRSRTNPPCNAIGNVYRCKDGQWIFIMTSQGVMSNWATLCQAMGMEDMIDDDRFNCVEKQRSNRSEIVELLDKKFAERTYDEWSEIFARTTLAYERIVHLTDVINDPQAKANRYFLPRQYESGKLVNIPSPPFKIDGLEDEVLERTIHRGEYTREVLRELGYSPGEIEYFKNNNIVYEYEMEEIKQ